MPIRNPNAERRYAEACAHHAHAQGLTPPTLILKAHGLEPQVLQTGGFCMVLEAYKDHRVQVWITSDGYTNDDVPTYLVCSYRPEPEGEDSGIYDGEEEIEPVYDVPLTEIPDVVRRLIREAS